MVGRAMWRPIMGDESIHDVGRIVGQAMSIEQGGVFGGEAMVTMMLVLVLDVVADSGVLERCDSEGSIPVLPAKTPTMGEGVVDPL